MSRVADLQWFQAKRTDLAAKYAGRWIVVHDKAVRADFELEEDTVRFAVEQFGTDVASVFLAAARDPVSFVGAIRA